MPSIEGSGTSCWINVDGVRATEYKEEKVEPFNGTKVGLIKLLSLVAGLTTALSQ